MKIIIMCQISFTKMSMRILFTGKKKVPWKKTCDLYKYQQSRKEDDLYILQRSLLIYHDRFQSARNNPCNYART